MPLYRYSALDTQGNIVRATLVATNMADAASILLGKGLTPMGFEEVEEGAGLDIGKYLSRFGRIRFREIVLFLRMMSAMLASGITITEAIGVMYEQTINRRFRYVLQEVKMQIEGGVSFSDALGRHPAVFPGEVINMIRAGEAGGILEKVLSDLVVFLEKRAALKKLIISSTIYPTTVLVVAIVVVVFLVTFVIPRFTTLLQGGQLPWNTQFLLDVSDFMIANASQLLMTTAGSIVLFIVLMTTRQSRFYIDKYKIFLPVFGIIARLGSIVQLARTLGSLLGSGIPLVEALTITMDTVKNSSLKKDIADSVEKVASGDQLSEALSESRIITSLMVAMVRIGEQSGNLDKQISLVAELYEEILEDRIKLMTSMIEPALIIFLGGVVGFVAWALVAGMLSMYSSGV